jgi:MFS family permease
MGAWNAAMALTGYSNGTPGFFNIIYLQETFGASYSQASWLILASAAGAMLWTPRIGQAIDRFGARLVGAWLMAVGPLFTLAWFFVSPGHTQAPLLGAIPQPVILMSSLSLIIGGFYAGVFLCQLRLTQALTVTAGRTLAMAVHWASVGCIASIGALAGGWIKDHFPPAWASIVLPFGAHCSYFQILVLIQALVAWGIALPILLSLEKESLPRNDGVMQF